MTERVIYILEAVQVDDAQRERTPVAFGHSNGLGQAVLKEQAVRQTGQSIVQRLVCQRFLGAFALRHVVHDRVQQLAAFDRDGPRVKLHISH